MADVAYFVDLSRCVDAVHRDLLCPICQGVIWNGVETRCQHCFCSGCLSSWLKSGKGCPVCRTPIASASSADVHPLPRTVTNILGDVKIRCSNASKGCTFVSSLSTIRDHEIRLCDFSEVRCSNEGCSFKGILRDIKTHSTECTFAKILCPEGCGATYLRRESSSHNCVSVLRCLLDQLEGKILALQPPSLSASRSLSSIPPLLPVSVRSPADIAKDGSKPIESEGSSMLSDSGGFSLDDPDAHCGMRTNVLYKWSHWWFYLVVSPGFQNLLLWNDVEVDSPGFRAIEFVLESNGWIRFHYGDRSYVRWTAGSYSPQDMNFYPWRANPEVVAGMRNPMTATQRFLCYGLRRSGDYDSALRWLRSADLNPSVSNLLIFNEMDAERWSMQQTDDARCLVVVREDGTIEAPQPPS